MKIILREDISKLGKSGDVIVAKDGYARNFLIPKGFAFKATDKNLKQVELDKKRKQLVLDREKEHLKKLADDISGVSCTVSVEANEEEQLYGSIDAADIVNALEAEKNIKIDKSCVVLEEPIKTLGIYEINIKLHPEVSTKIRVWVTKK